MTHEERLKFCKYYDGTVEFTTLHPLVEQGDSYKLEAYTGEYLFVEDYDDEEFKQDLKAIAENAGVKNETDLPDFLFECLFAYICDMCQIDGNFEQRKKYFLEDFLPTYLAEPKR